MPFPPTHTTRSFFRFLEAEAKEFYRSLPTDHTISVSERYDFWPANLQIMLRRIPRVFDMIPPATRQSGPIHTRKEVICIIDHDGNTIGRTTWDRDPNQKILSLFRLCDARKVGALSIVARMYGKRRSNRRGSIIPMYALHGIVIIKPPDGFAPLVARALAP